MASGHQSGNCEIVLAVLKRMGKPATFREVFAAMNVDERQAMGDSGAIEVQRRLNDLRHDGKVTNGDLRKCLVSDKPVQTWMVHG